MNNMLIRNIRSKDAEFIVSRLDVYGEDLIQDALDYKDYKKGLRTKLFIYTLLAKGFWSVRLYRIFTDTYINCSMEICRLGFILEDMDSIRRIFKG